MGRPRVICTQPTKITFSDRSPRSLRWDTCGLGGPSPGSHPRPSDSPYTRGTTGRIGLVLREATQKSWSVVVVRPVDH